MLTAKQMLDKIKWDEREDSSLYTIYYYDGVKRKLIPVSYDEIYSRDSFSMVVFGEECLKDIPLHRIKNITKDNISVWKRNASVPKRLMASV